MFQLIKFAISVEISSEKIRGIETFAFVVYSYKYV